MACSRKCMKPGPVTRNAYLNFLRVFRQQNCGLTAVQSVRKGAEQWRKIPKAEKEKYFQMAKCAPKTKRKKRSSKCKCNKSARRRKQTKKRRC